MTPTSDLVSAGADADGIATSPVGVIPAGGRAARLGELPCSKEILPLGPREAGHTRGPGMHLACDSLLALMARAGVRSAFMALRRGKWDVPDVLGDGSRRGLRLGYVIVDSNAGVPFTVDAAYEFVRGRTVVFGYPDLLMTPPDLFTRLLGAYRRTGADAVLGLFPAGDPRHMDLVDVGENGEVRAVSAKPSVGAQPHTWVAAVWGPGFTEHIAAFARTWPDTVGEGASRGAECEMADVLNHGIRSGLRIFGEPIRNGRFVDIGRPESLAVVLGRGSASPWWTG